MDRVRRAGATGEAAKETRWDRSSRATAAQCAWKRRAIEPPFPSPTAKSAHNGPSITRRPQKGNEAAADLPDLAGESPVDAVVMTHDAGDLFLQ